MYCHARRSIRYYVKMYEKQKGTDWSTLSQEMNQPRNTRIQYHRKCGDNIFLANSQSPLNICSILFFCLSMLTIKVSNAGTSGFKREGKAVVYNFLIFGKLCVHQLFVW